MEYSSDEKFRRRNVRERQTRAGTIGKITRSKARALSLGSSELVDERCFRRHTRKPMIHVAT
jgi:hypothetical protein